MDEEDIFIKDAMRKVMQVPKVSNKGGNSKVTVNHETLSTCLVSLAQLIEQGGDVYLPIFERLQQELEKLDHFKNVKAIALQLAKQSADNNEPK